ncbi:MAG TPA: hypothetical protein VGC36_06845, partial [Rhizomicrobium sp.]
MLIAACAAAQGAPLEAYGQLPTLDNLAISPEGTRIAYGTTIQNERVVGVRSIIDGKVLGVMKTGSQKLRDIRWASEDILVITLSVTHSPIGATGARSEFFMSQTYDLRTHRIKQVLGKVDNAMNVVLSLPQVRMLGGKPYLFVVGMDFIDFQGTPALFLVDLERGKTTLSQQGNRRSVDWDIDGNGTVFARSEYDRDTKSWRLKLQHGGEWHEVFSTPAEIETPLVAGMGPDGHSVILMVPNNGEWTEKHIDLANFAAMPPIGMTSTFSGTLFEPLTERII